MQPTAPRWTLGLCALLPLSPGCGSQDPRRGEASELPGTPPAPPEDPTEPAPTPPQGEVPLPNSPPSPVPQVPKPQPKPPQVPVYSRVLHVRPTGSDTAAGTAAAPLKTVRRAVALLRPGEAAYLH